MQVAARQCLWTDTMGKTGTMLAVEMPPNHLTLLIATGTLAPGSESVTIYWGDGSKSRYNGIDRATHAYAKPGAYVVTISDDISSFGYASHSSTEAQRDRLRELVALGSKVTRIEGYGFNHCHHMRGVMNLPNVTSIGGYAFGMTLGITDYILPSMTRLNQTSFYSGSSPTQIHADNVRGIDSRFWDYYGWHLYDLYLRNSTCAQIKAMSGFPFQANRIPETVRFHGSDGIVLKDGTIIPN